MDFKLDVGAAKPNEPVVIKISGRWDHLTNPQVENALTQLLQKKQFWIVLDLSELEFINSAGIKTIGASLREIRKPNRGDIRVSGMKCAVLRTFERCGYLELIQSYEDLEIAIESFTHAM